MSAQPQPSLTPEQYLALDRTADSRSEYYEGAMYAMSGGSHVHALIIGNIQGELRSNLKKRRCMVTSSELRVRVKPQGLYTYPDVVVICDPPQYADDQSDTLLNPALLIEVLSPSTEGNDRGFKAAQYRKIESLQEYALVSQTDALVELYQRQPNGQWLLSEVSGLDATVRFNSVDCSVAMAEIYDKVILPEHPRT